MKLNLWTWEGTIERGPYAVVGVLGFAIKHNLDRIVGRTIFHRRWSLFNYWIPFGRAVRVTSLSSEERDFLFWMIILSLPFIWIGVALTFRRLRALGAPLWLVALFFVPYLNLLFFLILCVYPSQTAEDLLKPARERENRTLNKIIPQSKWDFQAQDAEFLLTPLANGHTLLSGTSRYRNRMWPVAYWRLWSDAIVHQIHLRVFRHIKQLSEAAESKGAAAD